MPLSLYEAEYGDILDMMEVMYTAFEDPYEPFAAMMCPGLGPYPTTPREQGKRTVADRWLPNWKTSSTEHWLKVVDTDTSQIVSVSRWNIMQEEPFQDGLPPTKVEWLPEGSREQEYATFVLGERLARQRRRRCGPHVWLDMSATLPSYQRKGAGSLMMQWAIDKADEMNCDSYIEASHFGQQLYERFGFIFTGIFHIKRTDVKLDDEWKKLEQQWPLTYRWMWRPKQGIHKEGEEYPWGDAP